MSVTIAAPLPQAFATDDGSDAPLAGLPKTISDAQGRAFLLQRDAVSGLPQYRHADLQRDAAGNSLELEILITLADDGSFTRRTSQQLQLVDGDSQREIVVARHAADGTQTGEIVDSTTTKGTATTVEHTVGTYAAGEIVKRETDIEQQDQATDAKTAEHTVVGAKIRGVWEDGGRPITDATVPHVDRAETQRIESPGQGINKDTPRTLTFTSHGAGPLGAIDWDDAGTLIVRFDGRKGQYIEREMRVPLDQQTGAPNMDEAETVREDDQQNLVNKGLMQARIWGGLASNLSWVVGLNFARGSLGKGMVALSAAAAGAQLVGETHAVATRRNDGDWSRVAVSAYDMLLTGMLAAYMTGKPAGISQLSSQQRLGATALGGVGIATHAAQLSGAVDPIGSDSLTDRLRDAGVGAGLLPPAPRVESGMLDTSWRLEPRFDAAHALLG
jgi:hypothetical protein